MRTPYFLPSDPEAPDGLGSSWIFSVLSEFLLPSGAFSGRLSWTNKNLSGNLSRGINMAASEKG